VGTTSDDVLSDRGRRRVDGGQPRRAGHGLLGSVPPLGLLFAVPASKLAATYRMGLELARTSPGETVVVGHERRHVLASQAYNEPEEHWGDLRGPAAVNGRLRDIEMRLGQVRVELGEVGRWAVHPECPDISRPLKGVREVLQDAEREIRYARQKRLHR
jgi:hypothetical protein